MKIVESSMGYLTSQGVGRGTSLLLLSVTPQRGLSRNATEAKREDNGRAMLLTFSIPITYDERKLCLVPGGNLPHVGLSFDVVHALQISGTLKSSPAKVRKLTPKALRQQGSG